MTFSSSADSIATINENGIVTANSIGTATITATAASGVYAICTVTVHDATILNLPNSLVWIGNEALADLDSVEAIRFSDSVLYIADDALNGTDVFIYAPAGSYAAEWGNEHGFQVVEE